MSRFRSSVRSEEVTGPRDVTLERRPGTLVRASCLVLGSAWVPSMAAISLMVGFIDPGAMKPFFVTSTAVGGLVIGGLYMGSERIAKIPAQLSSGLYQLPVSRYHPYYPSHLHYVNQECNDFL